MKPIRPIRTEADYQQALARVEAIFDAMPGTPEFDDLDALGMLVCAYEAQHYPIPERGLRQRDLAAWLGGESRVSEILNRKRKPTAKMMKALHDNLGLSAEMMLAAA